MQATKPPGRFDVTCDGERIAGHAGAALLMELADRLGLTTALGWRAGRTQTSRHRHAAGSVLRDLAVLLADGGDCLSDLAVLRNQPGLFGPVASTPTAWRVVEQVACDPDGLAGLRAGRAHATAAAWRVGAHVEGLVVVDVDGTLLDAHSDKQGAAGTYKGGFGFYPLIAFLDRDDGTGEALAGSCGRATPAPVVCVRIGTFAERPTTQRHLRTWLSPKMPWSCSGAAWSHPTSASPWCTGPRRPGVAGGIPARSSSSATGPPMTPKPGPRR